MTRLSVAIAVARPGMIVKCLELLVANAADRVSVNLLLFGNGLTAEALRLHIGAELLTGWNATIIDTHPTNEGVPFALHRLWQAGATWAQANSVAPGDHIIAYLHDDAFVYGTGWDTQVRAVFDAQPRCGLAGFFGAEGLGLDRLYERPYEITNLVRQTCISNLVGAEHHGYRWLTPRRVAVLDGFSLIARQILLDRIDGWSWWPFPHHNYDTAICAQCIRAGMEVWFIPVSCDHLSGYTANNEEGAALLRARGGEVAIHHQSARHLYDMFRDVLPLRIR